MGISGRGARTRSTHLRHPCTVSHAEESGRGGTRRVGSAREPESMATSDSRREVRAWHGIPRLEAGREAPGLTRDDRPGALVVLQRLGPVELLADVVGHFRIEASLGVGERIGNGVGDPLGEQGPSVELEQLPLNPSI